MNRNELWHMDTGREATGQDTTQQRIEVTVSVDTEEGTVEVFEGAELVDTVDVQCVDGLTITVDGEVAYETLEL